MLGQPARTNRRDAPRRTRGERYTVTSYRRAVEGACDLAFPPPQRIARCRVRGAKGEQGSRWETPAEWKGRLGTDGCRELEAWRDAHRWLPHRLRHNAATHLRREFGIEVARVVLGHRSASVTELYAELDEAKAKSAMQRVG